MKRTPNNRRFRRNSSRSDFNPVRWSLEDVDGDSDVDMILHFKTQDPNLDSSSTEVTLTGLLMD